MSLSRVYRSAFALASRASVVCTNFRLLAFLFVFSDAIKTHLLILHFQRSVGLVARSFSGKTDAASDEG